MKLVKNVYSDIPMFIEPNPFDKDMPLKKDGNAIQESIRNIILTNNGERPFEFNFGTPTSSNIFENPDSDEFNLGVNITYNVVLFEPRARDVVIKYEYKDKTLDVDINYFIPNINQPGRITMVLERTR